MDGGGSVTPQPLFRTGRASNALLVGLRADGPPQRTTWDATGRLQQSQSAPGLFRLRPATLPELASRGSPAGGGLGRIASGGSRTDTLSAGLGGFSDARKPPPRAQKYHDLLMKHHDRRIEGWRKDDEDQENARREGAAQAALQRLLRAQAKNQHSDSDTDSDATTEDEPDKFGPLTAYEGTLKVDLEVCVLRAPGEKEEASEGQVSGSTTASSSASVSESTPRMDLAGELEALQQQLGADDDDDDDDSDGLPDDLRNRRIANIWDNPNMRWTLGIGGTVFFVPDAERYAHGPSLPPPPPRSLVGRRRLHIKPRLPLDISNHRYRDEHPNIWPEDPFSPTRDAKRTFEQKLMTLDFYASCSKALTKLPPLERAKDELKSEVAFGHLVEEETQRSRVWQAYLQKEVRRKRSEETRKGREGANGGPSVDSGPSIASLKAPSEAGGLGVGVR